MARRGDRASMREGPLAALFRRTDEEDEQQPQSGSPAPPAQPRREEPAAPPPPVAEEPARPHPSLSARTPEAEPEPEPRIPSPQERLRHAFSSELPDNVMAPPQAPPTPEFAPEPPRPPVYESDPYARTASGPTHQHHPSFGQAQPVTHPSIRVIGVGGAGVNAVNRMVEAGIEGVEFLAVNTDLQSLQQSSADVTLHIGQSLTRGLGSGSNPDLGRASAMDEFDKIKALLKGSDMVFITAGAGGGTGTGAAPVVARIAREIGALTVGIVTKPFGFEGSGRRG
jgi:cell division protein FtsZ